MVRDGVVILKTQATLDSYIFDNTMQPVLERLSLYMAWSLSREPTKGEKNAILHEAKLLD